LLRLDGAILTPPLCDDPAVLALLEEAAVPYVRIAPSGEEARSGLVRMDDRAAAAELTRHLLALGHTRVGFVKGDPAHSASRERFLGFLGEMASAGLLVDPTHVLEGDFSFRSGLELGETLLARSDAPSAVFASNDDMALGLLMIAMKHHLPVPDRLAIAGFDDAPTSRAAWPQLTTVNQPKAAMAAAAVDILTDPQYRHDVGDPRWRRQLDYQLRIRGSTVAET
jgi:LacI family transcriptional regulator